MILYEPLIVIGIIGHFDFVASLKLPALNSAILVPLLLVPSGKITIENPAFKFFIPLIIASPDFLMLNLSINTQCIAFIQPVTRGIFSTSIFDIKPIKLGIEVKYIGISKFP